MKPNCWCGFLSGFSSFYAFLIVVSTRKRCLHIKIRCKKRKTSATFKGKQRDNEYKAHPLSAVAVEISSERNHPGG
jgi:hypothetical protein